MTSARERVENALETAKKFDESSCLTYTEGKAFKRALLEGWLEMEAALEFYRRRKISDIAEKVLASARAKLEGGGE